MSVLLEYCASGRRGCRLSLLCVEAKSSASKPPKSRAMEDLTLQDSKRCEFVNGGGVSREQWALRVSNRDGEG